MLIETDDDVANGARALIQKTPEFSLIYETCQPVLLRRRPQGFATLLHIIVGQQVSVASAAAIWQRVVDGGFTDRDNVQGCNDQDLAGVGLSKPKIKYAKALANHDLDFSTLVNCSDDDCISKLTAITGIGTWTAEIYVITALGRRDVFPHGDLALQEAAKLVFSLEQ
ncbi:MAG: DNA-3-methyladenine glycosylase family protein, partial [Planktomarina sp.]